MFWRLTREDYETAIETLKRAVEAYPDYAPARGLLGFCLVFAAHMGWIDREQGLLPGRQHAIAAIALDDRDPWGHIALGYWAMMERRTEEVDRGISPGGQPQSEFGGGPLASQPQLRFCGAGSRGHRARRRSHQAQSARSGDGTVPRGIAVAHFAAGRYAEAAHTRGSAAPASGISGRATSAVRKPGPAGRVEEARSFWPRYDVSSPQLSIAWIRANVPYQTPELMQRYLEGMRKAGLKE